MLLSYSCLTSVRSTILVCPREETMDPPLPRLQCSDTCNHCSPSASCPTRQLGVKRHWLLRSCRVRILSLKCLDFSNYSLVPCSNRQCSCYLFPYLNWSLPRTWWMFYEMSKASVRSSWWAELESSDTFGFLSMELNVTINDKVVFELLVNSN